MSVVAFGLDNRTMPLDRFEQVSLDVAATTKLLVDLAGTATVDEAVVLSTCNRLEIYVEAERFHDTYKDVRRCLCERAQVPPELVTDHLLSHYDRDAIAHLFEVAAGLDSAVVGEHEILGQVRAAWERAAGEGSVGPRLDLLFRRALETGKRARTETGIARGTASVSHAAVEMAEAALGTLAGRRVLVLGAGEMGESMAKSLSGAGVAEILVANRTLERAASLARDVAGRAVGLGDLPALIGDVDVLLTSTGASSMLLEETELAAAIGDRAERHLVIVDIAVPRDVDPSAGRLPGVTLLDMDDLRRFASRGLAARSDEIHAVRRIVGDEVERFASAAAARDVAPLVTSLRRRVEELRRAEVARHGRNLSADERSALDAATARVLAKLLHQPTIALKDAAGTRRGDELADAIAELFEL